jgi:cytidylate kinase
LARKLAEKYKLRYVSGGDALKQLALEKSHSSSKPGWWESKEGLQFLLQRGRDDHFDEEVDSKLLEIACEGNVVLDSWTMPWLAKDAFKIWLEASSEKRAKRIAGRDAMNSKQALQALQEKEKRTKEIYKKLYGFELGEDFAPFNFILDTENLGSQDVFRIVSLVIDVMLCCDLFFLPCWISIYVITDSHFFC